MSKFILNFLIVFLMQNESQWMFAQNLQCQKVDFNRPTSVVHEFDECVGSIPVLKINSYAATTIQPFRPDSEFHLSATDEGRSCLQSTAVFTLDENSEVRTAIYLSMVTIGAWVEVQIFDRDNGDVMVMASLEESSDWISFSSEVNRTIEHAQVEIRAYMNTGSILAIEFIYVLNSAIEDEECSYGTEIETDPTVPTTDPIAEPTTHPIDPTTDPTTHPTDPTADPSEYPTEDPIESTTEKLPETTIPPTSSPIISTQADNDIWIILTIIFLVTTALSTVGLIYFMWAYRNVASVRSKLVPINDKPVTTLPRLTIASSVNGDHVIVGIEKQIE